MSRSSGFEFGDGVVINSTIVDGVRARHFDASDATTGDAAIAIIATADDPALTPGARVLMIVRLDQTFRNLAITSDDARRLSAALIRAAEIADGAVEPDPDRGTR